MKVIEYYNDKKLILLMTIHESKPIKPSITIEFLGVGHMNLECEQNSIKVHNPFIEFLLPSIMKEKFKNIIADYNVYYNAYLIQLKTCRETTTSEQSSQ